MGSNYPYLFILLDTVPDYIQKTFELDEEGRYRGNAAIQTIREGDDIPKDLEFAVILYNNDQWHAQQMLHLASQLQELHRQVNILWLPVQG